jgi:hypothetical protein
LGDPGEDHEAYVEINHASILTLELPATVSDHCSWQKRLQRVMHGRPALRI